MKFFLVPTLSFNFIFYFYDVFPVTFEATSYPMPSEAIAESKEKKGPEL